MSVGKKNKSMKRKVILQIFLALMKASDFVCSANLGSLEMLKYYQNQMLDT